MAYSSDFTVSKSSVFFENTEKGDLGGIIENIASSCNYTGFLSFDVMLCEDGTVRPIECNPRATSALHLYATNDRIAEAILNGQSIGCTGRARRLVLPMWINLASNLFKKATSGAGEKPVSGQHRWSGTLSIRVRACCN